MRFALYYTPEQTSPLWELGCRWLGRDAQTGCRVNQATYPGIHPDRLYELTRTPRRYGLHAALKSPFRLAPDRNHEMLRSEIIEFTSSHYAFSIPPLTLCQKNDSFCLCIEKQTPQLMSFASACVQHFDSFRAPLTTRELARRRGDILTAAEKQNLLCWGHPYFLDQYFFHFTLTTRITDEAEKELMYAFLSELFAPVLGKSLSIEAISLFVEPAPEQSLYCLERFPLHFIQQIKEGADTDGERGHKQNLYSRYQRHPA